MMQRLRGLLSFTLAMLLVTACTSDPTGNYIGRPRTFAQSADSTEASLKDPLQASVTIVNQPRLELASGAADATLKVPQIDLNLEKADFVSIIRCDQGFDATINGQKVSDLHAANDIDMEKLKAFWYTALGTTNDCVILGNRIARPLYQDLAAREGEFYYIINPCINPGDSNRQAVNCSFNLAVSNSVVYSDSLNAQFTLDARDLADAEDELQGDYETLYYLAQQVSVEKQQCETNYAEQIQQQRQIAGLETLLVVGVGAVMAGLITGGGAASLAVRESLTLGTVLFNGPGSTPPPIKCPNVDTLISQAQQVETDIDPKQQALLAIRQKMSTLETGYGTVDFSILGDTTTGQNAPANMPQ